MKPPQAPKHLSREMKKFWDSVLSDFELEADALLVLQAACENFDRAQQARVTITKEGLTADGRRHPCIDIEKQAYGLFLRSLRQLGLDVLRPGQMGRPPEGERR